MGRLGAEAMAEQDISIEAAMDYHLGHNHFPPRRIMVDACIAAIKAINETGDWETKIDLPDGVWARTGGPTTTASAIIVAFHLEPWIDQEDEY